MYKNLLIFTQGWQAIIFAVVIYSSSILNLFMFYESTLQVHFFMRVKERESTIVCLHNDNL